ncbi:MAG: glycosyltransferase family 2 protein [Bacteroidetes bacterium]|nr:glycosyltransferase family 2 protein [Bacteroidota bacterium]MBS1975608.1 glycosyltransferase family 2 protein [Bacteroidota bacterium]
MTPVSAVIITLNEERVLAMSLSKLYWCDEIIVVDSGSTDNTIKICKQFHCKIYQRKFDNYAKQKKFAVSLAGNSWVLLIDADEVLSDKLVEEIKTEMQNPCYSGYALPISLIFMDKEFRHGKEHNRLFLRLFQKQNGRLTNAIVHEGIEIIGLTSKFNNPIHHYSYGGLAHYFEKFNSYTSKGAKQSFLQGKQRSRFQAIAAIPLNFLKYYFLEKNFLNGYQGFAWSVLSAFYHFVKYLKLQELHAYKKELDELGIPSNYIFEAGFNIKKVRHELQS